jgi:biotin transport system substrate-specific component
MIESEDAMAEIILPRANAAGNSAWKTVFRPVAVPLAASALVALCAHVSIPLLFTPVPLSLAPFAVLFLGLVLGPRMAFASLSLYLIEGAAGLPVFSPQGLGGIAQLFGPTGGYLLSYPFAAALAGYIYRAAPRTFSRGMVAAGAASLLILAAGASWLKLLTHMDMQLIFAQAIDPFLPGDILKVAAAAGAAKLVGTISRHSGKVSPFPGDESL